MVLGFGVVGCSGKINPSNIDRYAPYETSSGNLYELSDVVPSREGPEVLVVNGKEIITYEPLVEDVLFLTDWAWKVSNSRARESIEREIDRVVDDYID